MFQRFLVSLILILGLCSSAYSSIDLNGDADYVSTTTMGNFGTSLDTNRLTLSLWIKTTTTTSMIFYGTVNSGSTTAINMNLNLSPALSVATGRVHIFRRDENNNYFRTGVAIDMGVTDGEWHNIILSIGKDSPNSTIWVDGVSQPITAGGFYGDGVADNMANFDFPIFIGDYNNRGNPITPYFNGEINEVYMWSTATALEQWEVDSLASARGKRIGLQIRPSEQYDYHPFDQGSDGTPLSTTADFYKDISGNGNHGTGVDVNGDSLNVAESVLSYP